MNELAYELKKPFHYSPDPVISTLHHKGKKTFVVRDDLLPGGSKQRGAFPFIQDLMLDGKSHFIYASPFSGFAQIALAYTAQALNARCTIICEKDQRFMEPCFHPFSKIAEGFGAKIVMVNSLPEAELRAHDLEQKPHDYKIPLGFDSAIFKHHLKLAMLRMLNHIEENVGEVKTLWMPVGSGTLARTMLSVLPSSTKLNLVNVRVLDTSDSRLTDFQGVQGVSFFHAPMAFHSPASDFPDIPSNDFYDAKLWAFIKEYGQDGDFWWNVAR